MLNRITIHGRLTSDPELRYTQSQTPVASFTVACDRDYVDQSGSRETDFISCVAWRQGAEFVKKYFHKGQLIVVDGRLQSRKWEDKEGNKRTSWEVITDHCYFGSSKQEEGGSYQPPSNEPPVQPQTFTELPDDDGELPF